MERSVLCMELMAREEAVEGLSEASIHAQVEAKILQHTHAAQLKSLEDNCLELQEKWSIWRGCGIEALERSVVERAITIELESAEWARQAAELRNADDVKAALARKDADVSAALRSLLPDRVRTVL